MTSFRSVGDDVLRWVSEQGSGSWIALSNAIGHVQASRSGVRRRPWQVAADLSALGHLDIDWVSGVWSASPPCLVLPRDLGLCAFLAGWRTSSLLERVDAAADRPDVYPIPPIAQGAAPAAHYLKCGSVKVLEDLAAALDLPVVFDASAQLIEIAGVSAPSLESASPPPVDEDLHWFDVGRLEWLRTEERSRPGLYRFELHGRRVFRLLEDDWWVVDRSVGQLRVLAGRDDLLRWGSWSSDRSIPRVLGVHNSLSLPPLAERALVGSSGMLPSRRANWRYFLNVPRDSAERLAGQLGIGVRISLEPFQWRN